MLLIADGKQKAFEVLYNRYSKRLLCFFYQKLYQDEDIAQDFLQDLFIKIIEKPHLFDAGRSFKVWIYTMAYNMCKNEYRKNAVRGVKVDDFNFDDIHTFRTPANLADKFDRDLFRNKLINELSKLEEKQSTVFILRYKEHLSIKEISEILDCSEGTVKSRLFYTLRKLAKQLQLFDPHKTMK